jgi:hypothetical protein
MNAVKRAGKAVYRAWMRFAHLLGTVNRYVFMTLFYWVIVDLTNIILRLLRVDLLDRRMRSRESYWHPKTTHVGTYKHQF